MTGSLFNDKLKRLIEVASFTIHLNNKKTITTWLNGYLLTNLKDKVTNLMIKLDNDNFNDKVK